jgi:hypothetical protein
MKFIGPGDASQLAILKQLVHANKRPQGALAKLQFRDPFARDVAKAIAGDRRGVSPAARAAASSFGKAPLGRGAATKLSGGAAAASHGTRAGRGRIP